MTQDEIQNLERAYKAVRIDSSKSNLWTYIKGLYGLGTKDIGGLSPYEAEILRAEGRKEFEQSTGNFSESSKAASHRGVRFNYFG